MFVISGTVKNGVLILGKNRKKLDDYLKTQEGKQIKLTVEVFRKKRSIGQNKYYWKVIIPKICEYLGYEKDEHKEVHKYLAEKFLGKKKSTADLTTVQFADYCERVQRWAAKWLYLYIPDPNE